MRERCGVIFIYGSKGSVAGCQRRNERFVTTVQVLLETEEGAAEPSLSTAVVLRNPEHLTFSDHLCCFNTFNQGPWAVVSVRAPCMARQRRLICRWFDSIRLFR